MSDFDGHEPGVIEQRSSVEINTTAKGEPVVRVKAYEGVSEEELGRLRRIAAANYETLRQELGIARAT